MKLPDQMGTFHIIGIGGIGMSAIAEVLIGRGYSVQGSDRSNSANVKRLRENGARVFVGHDPINLIGAETVGCVDCCEAGQSGISGGRSQGIADHSTGRNAGRGHAWVEDDFNYRHAWQNDNHVADGAFVRNGQHGPDSH